MPSEPVEPNPTENSVDLDEARRIADELLKLHRDGAIKGPADASFFARLIRDFCATYTAPKRTAARTQLALMCQLLCSASASLGALLGRAPKFFAEGSRRHG